MFEDSERLRLEEEVKDLRNENRILSNKRYLWIGWLVLVAIVLKLSPGFIWLSDSDYQERINKSQRDGREQAIQEVFGDEDGQLFETFLCVVAKLYWDNALPVEISAWFETEYYPSWQYDWCFYPNE